MLVGEIVRLHAENYGVYGRRKMYALMRRQGWDVGRDQVERLMRLAGVRGVKNSRRMFTTKPHPKAVLPGDLVNRRFTADAPRRLWVVDITSVATWSGFAYVAFVTDVYSRRIVGWSVAATLKAEILPLQALDMAAWNAGGDLTGLTHHSDHGSNYMAMVYTDRVVKPQEPDCRRAGACSRHRVGVVRDLWVLDLPLPDGIVEPVGPRLEVPATCEAVSVDERELERPSGGIDLWSAGYCKAPVSIHPADVIPRVAAARVIPPPRCLSCAARRRRPASQRQGSGVGVRSPPRCAVESCASGR